MQIDMHYGAVHFLALLAGIAEEEATKIAWSSQFVDDAAFSGIVHSGRDGYICATSAHRHFTDNFSAYARLVWIPFHFVPEIGTQGGFLDRLKCVKNSSLARAAVEESIQERDPFRFGVALHAYADTWAHQGFSGVWADSNLVHRVKRINSEGSLLEALTFMIGDLMAWLRRKRSNPLGHMLADVCPDLPFLRWRYRIRDAEHYVERDNRSDYREALEMIYGYMLRYAGRPVAPMPLESQQAIKRLISHREDDPKLRLRGWMEEIRARGWNAPEYKEERWMDEALGAMWREDRCVRIPKGRKPFADSDYHFFCEAIRKHSEFVVGRLKATGIAVV